MTDLSVVIVLAQFKHLEEFNQKRATLARLYFDAFGPDFEAQTGAELPVADFENGNWHMFHLVLPERIQRAAFMQAMLDKKIGLGYHYRAIHLFSYYRERGFTDGMFPVAERIGKQIVTLPLFPSMTASDVTRVVSEVKSCLL